MGKAGVQDAPHLIVVPNSLVDQWISELKKFFRKGTVEIYQVPIQESVFETYFTDENGAWKKSKTPLVFRILLCSASVGGGCLVIVIPF
jgi:SNF2 family DNA or RNA helicase